MAAETTFSIADISLNDVRLTADVKDEPYRYFFQRDVFPADFYWQMIENLPPDNEYPDRRYQHRMLADVSKLKNPFWYDVCCLFLNHRWLELVTSKFPEVWRRGKLQHNLRLVRDKVGYNIKPHTDIKTKAISLLFYLPRDYQLKDYGTTVFRPKQAGFTSDGNARYEWDQFEPVFKAPFVPNSVFGLARSEVSFHGTTPIGDVVRDVLLYNVVSGDTI